jgi:hypothetical protein
MVSAIGVQEMELLGDYHVNHSVHGLQLAGLRTLQIALPRFGSWNRSDLGIPYARNFYDSDQRPLRGILKEYGGPMLFLHGDHDPLVPVEAANEPARLVPQSELMVPETISRGFTSPRDDRRSNYSLFGCSRKWVSDNKEHGGGRPDCSVRFAHGPYTAKPTTSNWLGSALAMGMMLGTIASQMTVLGLEVQGDKRLLFALALAVFFATGINLLMHRGEIPIIGRRLA